MHHHLPLTSYIHIYVKLSNPVFVKHVIIYTTGHHDVLNVETHTSQNRDPMTEKHTVLYVLPQRLFYFSALGLLDDLLLIQSHLIFKLLLSSLPLDSIPDWIYIAGSQCRNTTAILRYAHISG